MSAGEWFLVACVAIPAGVGLALTIVSINQQNEPDDAEQRRAVSRPAELDDDMADHLRKKGAL